jgi:hypothetical protein
MIFRTRIILGVSLLLCLLVSTHQPLRAQTNIVTERYDNARTGANLNETQLNTSNVNVSTFGKLWSYTVSGSVQAQPLYVQGVTIPGKGTHNVLYIVTMNDVVYAFDADSNSNTPLWSLDITTQVSGSAPVPITDIVGPNLNIVGNVGIESTPQIDLTTNTMYLVARTKESGTACGTINGNYCQRLHALDITTGAEKFGGPTIIQGSVTGTGNASVGGVLTFDPKIHNQRSSLALANGQIFIAWASHEDQNPYHGWVMSYSASTLKQSGIFCSSPDGVMDGIWMSGRAPAVDASGNVYYMVGNGDWNGSRNFSESMLRFGSTATMPPPDWFTPDSWSSLDSGDVDYGSSGPILIPGTDLIAGAGKSSIFYVMHVGSLGHEQTGNGQIVQSLPNHGGEVKGGPVYWNRSGGVGPWMYVWSNGGDVAKAYHFNGATFDTGVISQGTIASPNGASGGVLTLSANGSTPGSGIIWSSMPLASDGDHGVHQGILRALNADDLTKELWNSTINDARDDMGNWPKYSPPIVVNGRVYMASFPSDGVSPTAINVYGLLPATPDFSLSVAPSSRTVTAGNSTTYTVSTTALNGFSGSIALSAAGLPSGASASVVPTSITGSGSSTLTVSTASTTPSGTSTITVTGSSSGPTHSSTTSLIVSAPSPAATPTFNPVAGTYTGSVSVTISDGTTNSTIYYTLDNSTPTTSSSVFSTPINISATTTIKAFATAPGFSASSVATAIYTIQTGGGSSLLLGVNTISSVADSDTAGQAEAFKVVAATSGSVSSLTAYADASNHATAMTIGLFTDANNHPGTLLTQGSVGSLSSSKWFTVSVPSVNVASGTSYWIAILGSGGALTFRDGNQSGCNSETSGQSTLTSLPASWSTGTVWPNSCPLSAYASGSPATTPQVATPTFNPAPGTYTTTQPVTISDATSGATIYYTTDNSTPTTSSTQYTTAISVSSSETIKAIAVESGFTNSAVATGAYTIAPPAATPTFNPVGGTYTSAQSVTISDSSPSPTIYYTTDGSTPTTSSTKYSSAIPISATTTLKAIATSSGLSTSAVASATYTIQSAGPTILMGTSTLTNVADSDSAGSAEAFPVTASASGTMNSLTIYVNSGNAASQMVVGLYVDNGGHPGALLTQGTSSTLTSNTWATVTVTATNVTSGVKYWIALLGLGGQLNVRDSNQSGCNTETSSQNTLKTLPATWSTGTVWPASCPLSGYGSH